MTTKSLPRPCILVNLSFIHQELQEQELRHEVWKYRHARPYCIIHLLNKRVIWYSTDLLRLSGLDKMSEYLFTSESVSEGHPDKVADQISDSILDAILAQDPNARVACETLCSTGLIVMSGEITTQANVDYMQVARAAVKRIGYNSSDIGFDYNTCE